MEQLDDNFILSEEEFNLFDSNEETQDDQPDNKDQLTTEDNM